MAGPLNGIRIVELAAIGPVPLAGTLLADLGASVTRIDRPDAAVFQDGHDPTRDVHARGRRSIVVDLRSADGAELVRDLAVHADVFLEGLRPGVAERLGLGPDPLRAANPRLVYGRMTGWGQTGPMAQRAGHDINYLALSGALNAIGTGERPVPPLNLAADFGGGSMLLALGVVSALLHVEREGVGQTIDAAMIDGVAALTGAFLGMRANGDLSLRRQDNLLDGGAPFYDVYACADGRFVAVGAIEPKFYATLCDVLGITPVADHFDRTTWPEMRQALIAAFLDRTRDEWASAFEATDACVSPVLDWDEAPLHPHHAERRTYVERRGVVEPAPAPRFDVTELEIGSVPPSPGADGDAIRRELGRTPDEIAALRASGAVV